MNKKILIATGLYPPDIGGPATYAQMITTELPKHGIEATVVPFGTVRHLPRVIRHVVFAWRLWRHASRHDLIYALDPISVGLPALLVSKLSSKPLWVRLGGDYAWEQGQIRFQLKENLDEYTASRKKARLPVRVLAWLQELVVLRAKIVVVPSEYLKKIVLTWGVEEKRLRVIYSALVPLPVTETKQELRSKLAYTNPTLVSAGRLVPWKGYKALINVIARLKEKYPDIQLVIAGEGVDKEKLVEQSRQRGIEKDVRLVGRLSKEALGGAKKAADIFVLNTAYEGLSHELLEVMDIGVPIVTTRVGGNPELIDDERSGLLIDFDDEEAMSQAILRLLESEQLRHQLTQFARIKTKDFDKTLVIKKLAELIKTETEFSVK